MFGFGKKLLFKKMIDGVVMVEVGLWDRLCEKYIPKYGKTKGEFLAAAVINELFSELPSNSEGEQFLKSNYDLIQRELSSLKDDREMCNAVTQAVRVKVIVFSAQNKLSPESLLECLEKLRRFGILVPGGNTPTPDNFLAMAYKFSQTITNNKGEMKKADEWKTLVHKSWEYGRKGKYWESIELAKKALELNPRAAEAWRLIGNAYEFLGDEKEERGEVEAIGYHASATEAWNKAKEIQPNIIIPGYHT